MRRYRPDQLREFLELLDKELSSPVEITIIGGAAVGLGYDETHTTSDVDLTPVPDDAFWKAVELARSKMRNPVPVESVSIYQPPYHWEERRIRLRFDGLRALTVLVPEVHDLAMMKVARGFTHDLQAVEDIHRSEALSLETLVERYYETRTTVIGSPVDLELSFLALVERLFGRDEAKEIEHRLASQRPPPIDSV